MEFRKKTTAILIAIFMISAFAVVIPVSAATTWYVDDGVSSSGDGTTLLTAFKTITEALAVDADGDVIEVYVGTYIEDLIIDVPNLELVAAEEGVTIKGVLTGDFPGHPANILINADGVKIHGFTIESPDVPTGETSGGIILNGLDIEIYENVFVSLGVGVTDYLTCVAIQTLSSLIPADSYISGLDIHHNEFSGTPDNGYYGVYINPSSDVSGLVTVRDNDFTGTIRQGIVTERSHTDITGNVLMTDELPTFYGYGIVVQCLGVTPPLPLSNILISSNIVQGSTADKGFLRGICLGTTEQDLIDILVTDNIVKGNAFGFRVRDAAGVTINYNDILDSTTKGIDNQDSENILDATLNWWGTTDGTLIANMFTGLVDYAPWLQDTITVTVEATGWTLTTSVQGLGSIDVTHPVPHDEPIEGFYVTGSHVTITATPDAGWQFVSWTVNSAPDSAVPTVMDNDYDVIATFALDTVSIGLSTLTVGFGQVMMGTVSGPELITITNAGNVDITVGIDVVEDYQFYELYLEIDDSLRPWVYEIPDGGATQLELVLDLTNCRDPGFHQGTLVFWAEQTP